MLIPPPYLDLLDPLPAKAASRDGRRVQALFTALLAAASGAVAGGLTAWLVVAALS